MSNPCFLCKGWSTRVMHLLMQLFSAHRSARMENLGGMARVWSSCDWKKQGVVVTGGIHRLQSLHLAPTGYKVKYPKVLDLTRCIAASALLHLFVASFDLPMLSHLYWFDSRMAALSLSRSRHKMTKMTYQHEKFDELRAHGAQKSHCPSGHKSQIDIPNHRVPIISLNSTLPVRCSCSWNEIPSATNAIFGLRINIGKQMLVRRWFWMTNFNV